MPAHVFDRIPNTPDPRDWKMADHLVAQRLLSMSTFDGIDSALAAMRSKRFISKPTLAWAEAVTAYLKSTVGPSPSPVPFPPSPTSKVWADKLQLDQGQTGHCVGFGWAQWGNTDPIQDSYANVDGDDIYYEAKIIDGEPGQENGSQVRSGAKAMKARGKLAGYVFAASVDEIRTWVLTKGPVVVGTDWTADMENPDSAGYVKPTGPVLGGHCYVVVGASPTDLHFQNSWGKDWGTPPGYFRMKTVDFAALFANQGDACAALEV